MSKLFECLNKIKKEKNINKPLVVKLSPDIDQNDISNIVEVIIKYKIDGIIISNTTDKNREKLPQPEEISKLARFLNGNVKFHVMDTHLIVSEVYRLL